MQLKFKNKFIIELTCIKIKKQIMLKTVTKDPTFQRNSQVSNCSSQIKLLKRSSRSKSVRITKPQSPSLVDQSFPTFFMKKVPKMVSKQNEENLQTTDVTPVKMIQRKNQLHLITEKKRQPTPSKSYKDLSESTKTLKKADSPLNLEKQMQIHQLEKRLHNESKIRLMYQQRAKQFQSQVSNQAKKVISIQRQLYCAKQKQTLLNKKISQVETQLQLRNNEIKSTKSSLQILKENIIQGRKQQYLAQIKKINQQIEKQKLLNQKQINQVNNLKKENTSLRTEISQIKNISDKNRLKAQQESRALTLKRQIQSLKAQLNISSTEKQRFLQQKVMDHQREILDLKKINQSKTIQMDFLARKKQQQLEILKKRKGQQLKAMRIKFAALMDEYKHLQDQKKSVKSKQHKNKSGDKRSVEKRQNRFACPISPSKDRMDDDYLCFSLSPEYR